MCSRLVQPLSSHPQPGHRPYQNLESQHDLPTQARTTNQSRTLTYTRLQKTEKEERTRPGRALIETLPPFTSLRRAHTCTNQKRRWGTEKLWRREAGRERRLQSQSYLFPFWRDSVHGRPEKWDLLRSLSGDLSPATSLQVGYMLETLPPPSLDFSRLPLCEKSPRGQELRDLVVLPEAAPWSL